MNVIASLAKRLVRRSVDAPRGVAAPDALAQLPVFSEDIRLIIWDLDETFWRGTLTEGDYTYVDAHHDLVIELARRGIISSICSMNHFERVRHDLSKRGLWDYFIFPSIDWTPKAHRIKVV